MRFNAVARKFGKVRQAIEANQAAAGGQWLPEVTDEKVMANDQVPLERNWLQIQWQFCSSKTAVDAQGGSDSTEGPPRRRIRTVPGDGLLK